MRNLDNRLCFRLVDTSAFSTVKDFSIDDPTFTEKDSPGLFMRNQTTSVIAIADIKQNKEREEKIEGYGLFDVL